jgi:hypothetical protein
MVFECLHDLPNPVEILAETCSLLKDSGTVLILEVKTPEPFEKMLPHPK